MTDEMKVHKLVELKMAGERRATADLCFIGDCDHDKDGYAPNWADEATVPLHRSHEGILGGSMPPFGIARIKNLSRLYRAEIEYLKTTRGDEEYRTQKALHEAGVEQPVSIGFQTLETAPPPDAQRAKGVRRYITRGRFLELSLVGIGAIPGAQLREVKQAKSETRSAPSYAEQKALMAEVAKKLNPRPVTTSEIRKMQREVEASYARFVCDTSEITEAQWKTARYWADRACDFMAESRVRIVWEVDDLKTAGCFRRSTPDRIFLNPTLAVDAIAATCIHECIHRKRFLRGLPNSERLVELDELELCELLGAA